jgi:glycosyltransferase involved in cell wall biosynthesis
MNIFISGHPLIAFTSGTPMRGLINALIYLRKDWHFTIGFPKGLNAPHLIDLKEDWKKMDNLSIAEFSLNEKWGNLKKLFGFSKSPLKNHDFDLFVSPGMPESFQTEKPVISFVADLSSINMPESSSLKWHGNRIFRNTLNCAVKTNKKIVSISDFTKTELEERYPYQRKKFLTIHNGIENSWFDSHYEENELTQNLKDEEYWIWWGYMSNRKNIGRLVDAYIPLAKKNNEIPKILFIGDIAPDQVFLKQTFKQFPGYFIHHSFQNPYILKTLVKNSKGLLFPSLYEGFGLPVIEAFSQEVPVMHSNKTSLPEIAGGLGIEVDPYDISSLERGMLKLANQKLGKEEKNKLKARAATFTYKNAAQQLSALIEELTTESTHT